MNRPTIDLTSLILAGLVLSASSACSSDDSSPSSRLAGEWLGTEEQTDGSLVRLRVSIDGSEAITAVTVDGASAGLTGTIGLIPGQSQLYEFILSDGTEGGFFMDDTATYAVFVDEEFNFGVLQKGATGLPSYAEQDLFGSGYSGVTVFLDGGFELDEVFTSDVFVGGAGSFSGSESSGTSFGNAAGGELSLFDSAFGAWQGQYESSGPQGSSAGFVRVFLSPDKGFAGSYACEPGGFFPEDCSFSAWRSN